MPAIAEGLTLHTCAQIAIAGKRAPKGDVQPCKSPKPATITNHGIGVVQLAGPFGGITHLKLIGA